MPNKLMLKPCKSCLHWSAQRGNPYTLLISAVYLMKASE